MKARTAEELAAIAGSGVKEMKQAVRTYQRVTASRNFRQADAMREKARHDEAQALHHARAEASAEASARAVLVTLEDRKIAMSAADRDRILRCTDAQTLDSWLHRAWRVPDISSLFAEEVQAQRPRWMRRAAGSITGHHQHD